jgi:sec-independent protein translocase protein TatA
MGPEWIVVGVVAVAVIFGAKKIPEMARSIGRAQGEFKKGLKEGVVDDEPTSTPAKTSDTPPPPPPPPPS